MSLPADFLFNQANLQDYVDCPRRFQLRHLLQLAWPAVAAEPADEYEAQVQDGEAFHRLVHQHVLGIIAAETPILPEAGPLADWWRAYLASPPADLPAMLLPEVTLSAPLAGYRLIAKYDLIAIEPDRRAIIVDWKTSARRPRPGWLSERMQTRVYRYLLVRAGTDLFPGLQPAQVEMIYWFANYPDQPERLPYDATQFEADGRLLTELVVEIAGRNEPIFPLTDDVTRCRFCTYRSLCGRGITAGDLDEADDQAAVPEEAAPDWTAGFDFEQIGEIVF